MNKFDNMVDLLNHFRVEYLTEGDRHCRPGWVQLRCPWCQSDKWHLGICIANNFANCYACGPHWLGGLNQPGLWCSEERSAFNYVKGMPQTRPIDTQESTGRYKEPKGVKSNPTHYHIDYLKQRGFDLAGVSKNVAYQVHRDCPLILSHRIFIPIFLDERPVSWTTRSIATDDPCPYMSAKKIHERVPGKSILYGEQYAGDNVIVHEGPFDVWTTGPGTLGTLGIGYTPSQMVRLTRYRKRYIAFDSEPAAQERAKKLVAELSIFPGETYRVELDTGKDSNSATKREVRDRLRRAVFGNIS